MMTALAFFKLLGASIELIIKTLKTLAPALRKQIFIIPIRFQRTSEDNSVKF